MAASPAQTSHLVFLRGATAELRRLAKCAPGIAADLAHMAWQLDSEIDRLGGSPLRVISGSVVSTPPIGNSPKAGNMRNGNQSQFYRGEAARLRRQAGAPDNEPIREHLLQIAQLFDVVGEILARGTTADEQSPRQR